MILESVLAPLQLEGKRFIQKTKYCILADRMGLGKSLTSLSVTNQAKKVVVVCPAYLKPTWVKELKKWLEDISKFVVVSYESTVSKGEEIFRDADIIIVDEAHFLKTVSSDRTKAIHHYVQLYNPKAVILLTGTPIKNRVQEFYSLFMLCSYGNSETARLMKPYFNYWTFSDHFSWGEKIEVNGHTHIKYSGHRNLEDLKAIMNTCYLRRIKTDKALPEMFERYVEVDVEIDIPKVDFDLAIESGGDKLPKSMSTAKAKSALDKAAFTADYAKTLVESGEVENVVIFSDHIDSSNAIAKALGVKAINSKTKGGIEGRQLVVDDFLEGTIKYLVATIGTLSTGVTLTNCSTMIFNDLSWVPGDNEQAKKRIHRMGQTKDCNYIYMVAGEMDRYIAKTIKAKEATIEAVL